MFNELARSTVQVFNESNEPVTDKIKAIVVKDAIRIFNPTIKIEPGFTVRHFIQLGDDIYKILEANYSEGMQGAIPPSYELVVKNINSISKNLKFGGDDLVKPPIASSIVNNTFHVGANGRVYQDSIDNSVNSIAQNQNNYSNIINQLREEIKTLQLEPNEALLSEKIIQNIEEETSQNNPSRNKVQTLISLLPLGVQALSAVAELGKIFGS